MGAASGLAATNGNGSANGSRGPPKTTTPTTPQKTLILPALSLLLWGAFSSSIIMTNKRVYSGGFPYPCALTGIGSGFSALAAALVARAAKAWFGGCCGGGGSSPSSSLPDFLRMRAPSEVFGSWNGWWGRLKPQQQEQQQLRRSQRLRDGTPPPPPPPSLLSWVLPVAVFTALSMALGNFPYLYLSVSFIQMLKASSPAWTLLLAAAAGLETPTAALAGAVGLIAAGTAATVLFQEEDGELASSSSSSSSNAAFGVALTLLSCVSEAARVVGSQALLQKAQQKKTGRQPQARAAQAATPPPPLNALESLVYVGAPASFFLLVASCLLREGGSLPALLKAARSFAEKQPKTALAAVGSSAAVNFASMAAVRLTSSLTFKVSGCAKNAAVMALAAAEHGDKVTPGQAAGYCLATSGFVAYAWIKARGSGGGAPTRTAHRRCGGSGGEGPAVATPRRKEQ